MKPFEGWKLTRRTLFTAAATVASPLAGLRSRGALAQPARPPTKVLDFMTTADMDKVKEEGAFVFYCHENEAGTAAIAEGFGKDFPQVKTSYVRAQTGASRRRSISRRRAATRSTSRPRPAATSPSTCRTRPAPSSGPASPSAGLPTRPRR